MAISWATCYTQDQREGYEMIDWLITFLLTMYPKALGREKIELRECSLKNQNRYQSLGQDEFKYRDGKVYFRHGVGTGARFSGRQDVLQDHKIHESQSQKGKTRHLKKMFVINTNKLNWCWKGKEKEKSRISRDERPIRLDWRETWETSWGELLRFYHSCRPDVVFQLETRSGMIQWSITKNISFWICAPAVPALVPHYLWGYESKQEFRFLSQR